MNKKAILLVMISGVLAYYFIIKKSDMRYSEKVEAQAKRPNSKISLEQQKTKKTIKESVARLPASTKLELDTFLKKFLAGESWDISPTAEKTKFTLGLNNPIRDFGSDREKEKQFLNGLLKSLAIKEDQIAPLEADLDSDDESNELSKSSSNIYIQRYNGYNVLGSYVSFKYRKSDNALLLVNLNLVDLGAPNLQINYSKSDIETKMRKDFNIDSISIESEPLIMPQTEKNAELVWSVSLKKASGRSQRYIVSAVSGKTLEYHDLAIE